MIATINANLDEHDGTVYIRGTRMKVRLLAEEVRDGSTLDDILEAHPHLTEEQVQAAYRLLHQEVTVSYTDVRH